MVPLPGSNGRLHGGIRGMDRINGVVLASDHSSPIPDPTDPPCIAVAPCVQSVCRVPVRRVVRLSAMRRRRSRERLQRVSYHLGASTQPLSRPNARPDGCSGQAAARHHKEGEHEGSIRIEGGRVISGAEVATHCETYRRDGFCHVPAVIPATIAARCALHNPSVLNTDTTTDSLSGSSGQGSESVVGADGGRDRRTTGHT